MHRHSHAIGPEMLHDKTVEFGRRYRNHECDIEAPVMQPTQDGSTRHVAEVDGDVRVGLLEASERPG